ncbi:hypothetical protein OSTOST_06981, partial [Ostertagia ostertagi]
KQTTVCCWCGSSECGFSGRTNVFLPDHLHLYVILKAYHVALSSDDVTLQYELLPGSFSASSLPFRVHQISGEITSEAVLDHETNKNYEFKATDADSGINGDVNYAINPPSAVFGVDYHTGVVQTIASS